MKTQTDKIPKQRKFLVVLPLLVLPFITMTFWALGGGQGSTTITTIESAGLSTTLPDPHFDKSEIGDKLCLYEIAARDSAKFEEARESDPYFDLISFKAAKNNQPEDSEAPTNLIQTFPHKEKAIVDPNEEKVNQKLDQLYREINKSTQWSTDHKSPEPATTADEDPQFTSDVDRLESMMELLNDQPQADPEMQQIESMLEKILDIQHPQRVMERLKAKDVQAKEGTFSVEPILQQDNISLINTQPPVFHDTLGLPATWSNSLRQNSFFGLDDEHIQPTDSTNTIQAVIHGTQELVEGATVKMRILDQVTIDGNTILQDQFVFGTCAINGERLTITINSIRYHNSLLPVSLSVYDLDGMEGIYIPGAIAREAAKQASDDAMQNMQLLSMDPTLGQQAANAGLEATKNLLSRKAKLVKVTVKAGYRILLKDSK